MTGGLLRGEGDRLHFQVENQARYFWGTLSSGDDTSAFGRHCESEPWEVEPVTLAEHLILDCVHEAKTCHAVAGASSAALDDAKFQAIVAHVPAMANGPWRWCETHFYVGSGVFMFASLVGEEKGRPFHSVWLGAKRPESLGFLKPLLGDEWDHVEM